MSRIPVDPRLAALPQCRTCTRRQLQHASRFQTVLELPPGRIVIRPGDTSGQVVLILSGLAGVRDDHAILAVLGPGDLAGATSIDGAACRSTVLAETDLGVAVMTQAEFRVVLTFIPRLVIAAPVTTQAIASVERSAAHV